MTTPLLIVDAQVSSNRAHILRSVNQDRPKHCYASGPSEVVGVLAGCKRRCERDV